MRQMVAGFQKNFSHIQNKTKVKVEKLEIKQTNQNPFK